MSSASPRDNSSSQDSHEPLVSEFAGERDMAELIEFFIGELKDRVATIETAWQSGDQRRLQDMAHQLKGAAACYGYQSITNSAAALEYALMAEEAELSALSEKVEDLIGLCRRAAASGS